MHDRNQIEYLVRNIKILRSSFYIVYCLVQMQRHQGREEPTRLGYCTTVAARLLSSAPERSDRKADISNQAGRFPKIIDFFPTACPRKYFFRILVGLFPVCSNVSTPMNTMRLRDTGESEQSISIYITNLKNFIILSYIMLSFTAQIGLTDDSVIIPGAIYFGESYSHHMVKSLHTFSIIKKKIIPFF